MTLLVSALMHGARAPAKVRRHFLSSLTLAAVHRHPLAHRQWYCEAPEVSAALFRDLAFEGGVVDPACGQGCILVSARAAGVPIIGADIEQRRWGDWPGADEVVDFFADHRRIPNLVSNPPYDEVADRFLAHALERVDGRIALLLPLRWVAGEKRARTLARTPLEMVRVVSPRPSIPPGAMLRDGEIERGGGSVDFAWFVWCQGFRGKPSFGWCFTKPA